MYGILLWIDQDTV